MWSTNSKTSVLAMTPKEISAVDRKKVLRSALSTFKASARGRPQINLSFADTRSPIRHGANNACGRTLFSRAK